jgi:hypothetical protein
VYNVAFAEPGVRWIDRVRLRVADVPAENVTALAVDSFQPDTWYAASGSTLFRSTNNGEGWEKVHSFGGGTIRAVLANRHRAGLLAALCWREDGLSLIYLSEDAAETWSLAVQLDYPIYDITWSMRGDLPLLLLATEKGLFELLLRQDAVPLPIIIDPTNPELGVYAVAVAAGARGSIHIAVALQDRLGVFLLREGGPKGIFERIGLPYEDIRHLAVQYEGSRTYLWAGAAAAGRKDNGRGCFRWELHGSDAPEGPVAFSEGWQGGSCLAIVFAGGNVLAASHRQGVLLLTPGLGASWIAPEVRCGLPLRDTGRFNPVRALASDGRGRTLLAGGSEGVYRSLDGARRYELASNAEFTEQVLLPETWLFVSGEHKLEIVSEDEAIRD